VIFFEYFPLSKFINLVDIKINKGKIFFLIFFFIKFIKGNKQLNN
jgi:hypothetical protein